MVAIEQVRMLNGHADTIVAGGIGAAVVEGRHELERFFVGDIDYRVYFLVTGAGLKHYRRALGRVFGQQLKIAREQLRVWRGAGLESRQARTHVALAEKFVAFNDDLADGRLDHAQTHHAARNVLLRQQHLDHTIPALDVYVLERLERALNI